MAVNSFDDALALIKDPDKAKIFKEISEEIPDIRGGWLRQSDYSKKMNDLSEEKKQLQTDLEQLQNWRSWRRDNWDDDQNMTNAEREKLQEIEALNSELEVLKAAQEAGMTFDEVSQYISKELDKKQVVTRDYIDKEFRSKLVDQDFYAKDVKEKLNNIANGMEYLYEETFPLGFSHRDEFGEVLKPRDLIVFANENGIKDIGKAYEAWVAPRRNEAQKKKTEEMVAKAKQEGREEALKTQAMGQNGRMPTDSGAPQMGHMEAKLRAVKQEGEEGSPISDDIKLGSGISASVAALYRRDVAEGKVLKD